MSLEDFFCDGPRSDATSPVPAIAAKAADLEAYRKSVEDSATVNCGLWLSYIFVLFYLGVAAGAVTHADLLLRNPVKLPFLNTELPLLPFFFLAPVLLVITHAYTLVNLALLADRVREFHKELGGQLAADLSLQPRASKIRSFWMRQLPSNIFVQILGGPDEICNRVLGKIIAGILSLTLVGAPIALLLLLQLQFLPYHSRWVTWTNRIALVVDLVLIGWLWGKILRIRADHLTLRSWRLWLQTLTPIALLLLLQFQFLPYHSRWTNLIALVIDLALIGWLWGRILRSRADHLKLRSCQLWLQTSNDVLASVCIILFAVVIATIPGEWQEKHLSSQAADLLRRRIFEGDVDLTTRRRTGFLSNTLVVPGFNIYEALKIDDPKKVERRQHLIDLRGRDLEGAILEGVILPRADLTGAQLQGAWLGEAQLQGASLDGAQLQGASLRAAQLQGAVLDDANLQGAWLDMARLQGASLHFAQLQGARLFLAHLEGASLNFAQLQGAWLFRAQLQGASLFHAQLQGAGLDFAHLQGAQLGEAQLQGAKLFRALLWRAQLSHSVLKNIFDSGGEIDWSPIAWGPNEWGTPWTNALPWTDATYAELRQSIEREVSEGHLRSDALEQVAILDCSRTNDKTLASCNPSEPPPDPVQQWKNSVEGARIDRSSYAKALAATLGDLVCTDNPDIAIIMRGARIVSSSSLAGRGAIQMNTLPRTNDQIYVLRGLLGDLLQGHLVDTGPEMPALMKRIASAECPLSKALTEADKWLIAAHLEKWGKSE